MVPLMLLALASLAIGATHASAEVIKRVNPDGSVTLTVVHTIPTLTESAAKIRYPDATGLAAVRERIRAGPGVVVTHQREDDGRLSVTMPTSDPYVAGGGVIPLQLREAKEAYDASLDRLKQDPGCVECRQDAVELGRQYRALGRPERRPTVYDESAIANDLNAVTGRQQGVPVYGEPPPVPVVPSP